MIWILILGVQFPRRANASRKFTVLGSGYAGATYERARAAFSQITLQAARVLEHQGASDYLASLLRSSDRVLLKGSVNADHLGHFALH